MSTITAQRQAMRAGGIAPVPVLTGQKHPGFSGWQQLADASAATVDGWETTLPNHGSTGVLCGKVIGIDLDAPDSALANELEMLAMDHLGMTPLRRVGQGPKLMLVYRAAEPGTRKSVTPEMHLADGRKVQVEALATGQQFVAFGIHPGTGELYSWADGRDPSNTSLSDLPVVTEAAVRAFLTAAADTLRAGGATGTEGSIGVSQGARSVVPNPASLVPPDAATLVDLLNRAPNPVGVEREQYMRVMLATSGSLAGLIAASRLRDGDE